MLVYMVLYALCTCTLYCLLQVRPVRTKWRNYRRPLSKSHLSLHPIARILLVRQHKPAVLLYKQLLLRCGFELDVITYIIVKRCMLISSMLLSALLILGGQTFVNQQLMLALYIIVLATWMLILFDKSILHMLKRRRRERIVKDIHAVSKQLLYYHGSRLNVHSKIKRCLPFTTTIRREMELLVNEWYEGAAMAIDRFKQRIGTEEGQSFAETIDALRLNDDQRYYDLLKQRIADYKEKMQLQKESKSETSSYILFVLAGLPIINTFRVFIYPWVQEGQKLFESLS